MPKSKTKGMGKTGMAQSAPVLRSRIIAKDGERKTLSLAEPQRSQRKESKYLPSES